MREVWDRLKENGDGWYWVVPRLRAGDVYHLCSFAAAFKKAHGDAPIFLVVSQPHQANMARVFDDHLAKVIVEPGLSQVAEDWRQLMHEQGLPAFGMNSPLLLDPWINVTLPPSGVHLFERSGMPWIQLYKYLMRIPFLTEPTAPAVRPDRVEEARRLAEEVGMAQGRSVLLFPYAQTYGADVGRHFARLAEVLSADYEVFTSVAPGETEIAGTKPVFIPFALLPEVAEYAGWAVVLRSGIADILASARCRRTIVYRDLDAVQGWSLLQLDLARDASEFAFPFGMRDPDAFVGAVMADPKAEEVVYRPQSLGAKIEGRHVLLEDLASVEMNGETLVVHDVPYRGHPRREPGKLLDRLLAPLAQGARLYAGRDSWQIDYSQGSYPFWEEIDAELLSSGQYYAAGYWHSLLLTREAPESYLPLEAITDTIVDLADPRAMPAHARSALIIAPFSYKGVTLIEGWYPTEGWGAWGQGGHSRIRLVFGAAPTQGYTVVLGANLVMSDRCPEVRLNMSVNGTWITDHVATLTSDRDLRVPVPPSAVHGRVANLDVRFERVLSPLDQGLSGDPRPLGLGLRLLKIEPFQAAELQLA